METETSPGEFQPFANLPDIAHVWAAGMFMLGVVLGYMMWESGARGMLVSLILFPVSMAAGLELVFLLVVLYQNLDRAETNGTLPGNWRRVRRGLHAFVFVWIVLVVLAQLLEILGFL